jgi:hypothetical protein
MSTHYNRVLWVDDDIYQVNAYSIPFLKNSIELIHALTVDEALDKLKEYMGEFDLIIIDVWLDPGERFQVLPTKGGYSTGLVLAATIQAQYPDIPLMGLSISNDREIIEWFQSHGDGYLHKKSRLSADDIYYYAESIISEKKGAQRRPTIFIIHGHDDSTKESVKRYIIDDLGLPEPIILHEQPNHGRTIIEKFEEETHNIDIVFTLLTPDDTIIEEGSNDELYRARQNVIFELGYFIGKLGRRSGSILLCYKGNVELPSDIQGMLYIKFDESIQERDREIRNELLKWL